jgi:pentatricopeptide repeat protein
MIWEDLITKRSLTPNDWALGYMLDALVNNDHIDEAISLLNKWERTLPPSTYFYGTILKGLANTNQSDRAMEVYANMKETGRKISTFIFTTLIDMQARIGVTDQVSKLVRDMQSMGYKSDDYVASSTIMKAYIVNGDIEEAFQAFRGMQKSGLACDSVYNSILEGAIRVNRMDLADVVVEDLQKSNARPSNHTLCTLMKMYGRRRQVQKAFDILEQLSDKHALQPSARVKSCLMCSCLSSNCIDRAYEVYEDIKRSGQGQGLDAKTYNPLILNNVQNGWLDEAVRLVEEAYGLGQRRCMARSEKLQSDVMEHLFRALARQGRTDSVGLPLFEKIRASGIDIESRVFNTIIS